MKRMAWHIGFLTLLLALYLTAGVQVSPMDDFFDYERFAETLGGQGRLDFSIPGLHGLSLFAAPLYTLTRWPLSVIGVTIACAILIVPLIYATAAALFDSRAGYFAACLYLLMPWLYTQSLRGFTVTGEILFMLLTIYLLVRRQPYWAAVSYALALLVKPFALCALPFFWLTQRQRDRLLALLLAVLLTLPYFFCVYRATGQFIYTTGGRGTEGFDLHHLPYNLGVFVYQALGLPLVDTDPSFAGAHYFRPSLQLTSVAVVFGLLTLLYPGKHLDRRRRWVFAAALAIGALLPSAYAFVDTNYTVPFAVLAALLAAPFLARFPLAFALVLLSSGFQFLSLYLLSRDTYFANGWWPIALLLLGLGLDSGIFLFDGIFRCELDFTKAKRGSG